MSQHGSTHLEAAHLRSYAERGYFVIRGLVTADTIAEIRRRILACVKQGGGASRPDLERAARGQAAGHDPMRDLRKLGAFGRTDSVAWRGWWANPDVLAVVRPFVGEDVAMKFDSVFLKPARVGGPTPWHQDPGLWRDDDVEAFNGWLAIDPSDRGNGCLQVVPGSHTGPVVPHVEYPDSIHVELPRDRCRDLVVDHIELDPGDALFWHSNLWHHSPPNTSDRQRIGMGAVWTSIAFATRRQMGAVVCEDGHLVRAFPPRWIAQRPSVVQGY
jgi:phytanoyl-CoA hydroxylase